MRLRVFLCVVWGIFSQDSVFVSKTYNKAELDLITPNFMWQGEHVLNSNKEVSTSFDGFQLHLPLSRYDISELSVFRGMQPASFTRNTAGAIAYTTGAYAKNISAAAIVNTSEIDAYGSNTIYGRVSGNIFDVASVYASIETNETLDWNPSYIDTKFHEQKSSEYKPNNGLENTKFFVKAKFDVLGFEPEVYFFNEDLNFSSYSHYFAKLNSEHNPYTERNTQFLGAKISKEIFGVEFSMRYGRSVVESETGDGVHFNKINDYGLVSKNYYPSSYTDDTTPTDGRAMTRSEYNWGLFSERGRVSNEYSKSKKEMHDFEVAASFRLLNIDLPIQLGMQYQSEEERAHFLAPIRLQDEVFANILNNDKVSIYHQLAGGYGYDLFGNETSSNYDYEFLGQFNRRYAPIGFNSTNFFIKTSYEYQSIYFFPELRYERIQLTGVQHLKSFSNPLGGPDSDGIQRLDKDDLSEYEAESFILPRLTVMIAPFVNSEVKVHYGRYLSEFYINDFYTSFGRFRALENEDKFTLNGLGGKVGIPEINRYAIDFSLQFIEMMTFSAGYTYNYTDKLPNYVLNRMTINGSLRDIYARAFQDFSVSKILDLGFGLNMAPYFNLNVEYQNVTYETAGLAVNYTSIFRNPDSFSLKSPSNELDVLYPFSAHSFLGLDQLSDQVFLKLDVAPRGLVEASLQYVYHGGGSYTPVASQDVLLGSTNIGNSTGSPNSGKTDALHRFDLIVAGNLELENLFNIRVQLGIENVFNTKHELIVYQTTGKASTTGFLDTDAGKQWLLVNSPTAAHVIQKKADREAYENAPDRYGAPRRIFLSAEVSF